MKENITIENEKINDLKLKTTWKDYLYDWRFWYKLIFMLWSVSMTLYPILWGWIHIDKVKVDDKPVYALYNDAGKFVGYDYWAYFVYTFTFFTCQSNILVMIWFITAVIFHTKEGKIRMLKANYSIAVATYITLTCLLAMAYMLPLAIISKAIGAKDATSANPMGGSGMTDGSNATVGIFMQLSLHLFLPIGLVLYVALFLKREKVMETKTYMKKMWWRVVLYPICYLIMVQISGALIHASHAHANYQIEPQYYLLEYPYFFFYLWQNGGVNGYPLSGFKIGGIGWAVITAIVMFAIVLGFSLLYNLAGFRRQKKVLLMNQNQTVKIKNQN